MGASNQFLLGAIVVILSAGACAGQDPVYSVKDEKRSLESLAKFYDSRTSCDLTSSLVSWIGGVHVQNCDEFKQRTAFKY
jgi:hypothetical protein